MLRLALVAVVLAAAAPVSAQEMGRIGRSETIVSTAPGYYVYHEPGQATIQVAVEGAVENPGLYEVALGTDLARLLALTGGPAFDARQPDRKQRVEIRVFRDGAGQIYAATLQDLATNAAVYPDLREGDSMVVEVISRQTFGWRDVLSIAGGVTAVAYLVERLF